MHEQVSSWTAAFQTSLSNALHLLLATIPQIAGALLLLGIGWAIASVAGRAVSALLGRARFNNWVHRSGLGAALGGAGVDTDAIGFVALAAKWFIRLIALVVAFDALGLSAVADTLRLLLLWLPNLIVALVILVLGGLGANAIYGLVRAGLAPTDVGHVNLLAGIAWASAWICAVVLALYQVGIARELVTSVFTALVAGLALALGLAFGLGGRDVAGEIVRDVYERLRTADGTRGGQTLRRSQERSAIRREH
jgi:hypothetical protein